MSRYSNPHPRMKALTGILLASLASVVLATTNADAGVRRIWAVNDGEKIDRDAKNHPASSRNSVWDGRMVRLFGGRNEVVAFQVIVEADARGVNELTVRLPALISGR